MAEQEKTCTWTYDDDDFWATDCGQAFCFSEGTLEENHNYFCSNCGHRIVAIVPAVLEDDEANDDEGGLTFDNP